MKKTLVKLMLLSIIFFGTYYSASAQIYIKVRPVALVVVQTARPGPTHVWIGEERNEDGNRLQIQRWPLGGSTSSRRQVEPGTLESWRGIMVIIGFAVVGEEEKDNLKQLHIERETAF